MSRSSRCGFGGDEFPHFVQVGRVPATCRLEELIRLEDAIADELSPVFAVTSDPVLNDRLGKTFGVFSRLLQGRSSPHRSVSISFHDMRVAIGEGAEQGSWLLEATDPGMRRPKVGGFLHLGAFLYKVYRF